MNKGILIVSLIILVGGATWVYDQRTFWKYLSDLSFEATSEITSKDHHNASNSSVDTSTNPDITPASTSLGTTLQSQEVRSNKPSISYQVVRKTTAEKLLDCNPGRYTNKFKRQPQNRRPLQPELQELTNFSTTLSVENMRILIMGSSVGMQLFEMIDMAIGGSVENRTILEYAWGDHYSSELSSTKKLGAWRMTGMFLRENEGKLPPNAYGGGWNLTTARRYLNLPDHNGHPIQSFDVILFLIPHGWINNLKKITIAKIVESLQLSSGIFGVKQAILLTMPFINNIEFGMLPLWFEKNREIRNLVSNFEPNHTIPGIDRLVLMDLAELTNQFIQVNAGLLGYLNNTKSPEMTYLDVRLVDFTPRVRPAAAHVCAGPLFKRKGKLLCDKNGISSDGMHMCTSTYAGHVVAATGCLLQCLNTDHGELLGGEKEAQAKSVSCQKDCNDKYMTLGNVNATTLGSGKA